MQPLNWTCDQSRFEQLETLLTHDIHPDLIPKGNPQVVRLKYHDDQELHLVLNSSEPRLYLRPNSTPEAYGRLLHEIPLLTKYLTYNPLTRLLEAGELKDIQACYGILADRTVLAWWRWRLSNGFLTYVPDAQLVRAEHFSPLRAAWLYQRLTSILDQPCSLKTA